MPLTGRIAVGRRAFPRFDLRFTPAVTLTLAAVAHFVLHALPLDLGTRDDADQFVFAQQLSLGYHEQPPLYSWLLWVAFQLGGRTLVAYAAFKTLVLVAVALAAWAAARELVADPKWRFPAAAGAVFLPSLSWHAVTYLTHSNLLVAACYATLAAAVRLGRLGRTPDYLLLGVVVGLGGMTKYNYAQFAAALLAAGLTLPAYRARLLDRRIVITALVAGLIVLPHAVWLAGHWGDVWPAVAGKVSTAKNRDGFGRALAAVAQLPLNLLLLVVPLLLVARWAVRLTKAPPDTDPLVRRTLWVGLASLVLIAVGGAGRMHERWLVPFVILVPFVVFARAAGSPRRALIATSVAAVALVVGRAAQVATGGGAPFPATEADALKAIADAAGPGRVIVAETRELAGALAYRFPDSRVVTPMLPAFQPWPGEPTLTVWMGDKVPGATVAESPAPRSPYRTLRVCYLLADTPVRGASAAADSNGGAVIHTGPPVP